LPDKIRLFANQFNVEHATIIETCLVSASGLGSIRPAR
jgi:hypothetical protein